MSSRISGRLGRLGAVLTVALTLAACDPSTGDGAATTPASPAAVTTTAASAPVATPPVGTAAATPPPAEPAATQPPATKVPAPPAPQPKVTTAKPPTDNGPEHTAAAGGPCEIRSNAGNCYEAGQFCRNADLGRSTHDAAGRVITCRMVSGKPHWQA